VASYLETAMDVAREAGGILATLFERRVPYELKGESDLVTEADRASERLVVERLQSHFPTHSIVAEESGAHDRNSDFRWYVDPLDGTTNFAHGFPVYNITLALERSGELVAGVIFDPTRQEMFTAERGGGAYLNGHRIHVSKVRHLKESLVATGFPSYKRHQNVNVHFYYQLAMMSHGVRRAGSAAIDLAYVACGRLDAFWEFGLKPWDMAAGVLLIAEAGGRCSDMDGGPMVIGGRRLLGDNGLIHDEIVGVFGDIFTGKFRYSLPEIQG
jgi:myo-inositol-1(or 4)-monophosphatase